MTSPYNRINRLRARGWTWDALGRELAKSMGSAKTVVARNTLRSIQNLPHYKPGKELSLGIQRLHDQHIPSPFPMGVNALMALCRDLMNHSPSDSEDNIPLNSIELHVAEQLQQSNHPPLIQCRLHWILGNINQFNMRADRLQQQSQDSIHQKQAAAIHHYQSALEHLNNQALPNERYKLGHNIFVCYVNAVPEPQRNNNTLLAEQLETIAYRKSAQQLLESEPFQWQTARNALLYSSITQDREAAAYFYQSLLQASRYFCDLNYQPLGCDPLISDPSMKWALNNVLTPNLVETINEKLQRQQPNTRPMNQGQ